MKLHKKLGRHFDSRYWVIDVRPELRGSKFNAFEVGAKQAFRLEPFRDIYSTPHLQTLQLEGYEMAKRWTATGETVFCFCCRRPYQAFGDEEIATLRAELDAAREAILLNTTRKETSDGKVVYLVDEETTYESDEDYPAIHAAHEAQRQKASAAPAEGDPGDAAVRS